MLVFEDPDKDTSEQFDLPKIKKEITEIDSLMDKRKRNGRKARRRKRKNNKSPYVATKKDLILIESNPDAVNLGKNQRARSSGYSNRKTLPDMTPKKGLTTPKKIDIRPDSVSIDDPNDPQSKQKQLRQIEEEFKKESLVLRKNMKDSNLTSDKIFSKYAIKSKAGMMNGVSKINQDSFFVETKLFGIENLAVMSVFDGHGKMGHRVSGFIRANLRSKRANIKMEKVLWQNV